MIETAYFSYWSGGERTSRTDALPDEEIAELSLALCRRHFRSVHLVTDDTGRAKFGHLGFDSISTELNGLDPGLRNLWCLGKLKAYLVACRRGAPFLHVDFDVFLWPHWDRRILSADLCAQNPEPNDDKHYEIARFLEKCPSPHILRGCLPPPHEIPTLWPRGAANMGIFGGNDLAFIEAYARAAVAFATDPANKEFFAGDTLASWQYACIVEQYFFTAFAYRHERPISYLFPDGWPVEPACQQAGYTHLIEKKRDPSLLPRLRKAMKQVWPEPVVKVYGLPRTGTNVTELLLAMNLQCYVAAQDEFSHPNMHYLGWKHGLPPTLAEWEPIEQFLNQKVYCVFMQRPYESWVEAVTKRHNPSHEFPRPIARGILYATPLKHEYYPSYRDLHTHYDEHYSAFAQAHPERAVTVPFDLLRSNQEEVVRTVAERFGLPRRQTLVTIDKPITSAGKLSV
jgi:hypothetical protein